MTISSAHLDALKALGYTAPEAGFLYLVATHSGYFVARQFLGFTGSHWGKRTTTFWAKLHAQKHARTECFPKSGVIYHLFSRRLYRQIGRENLRNRREHEIEFIRQRIAMLDFVLTHPERTYLETEPEKVHFFCEQLKVPSHFLPARTYHGDRESQPTTRYFVDKFPMFLGDESLTSPVVTFTFIQGSEASMTELVHHLEAYLPCSVSFPSSVSCISRERIRISRQQRNCSIHWLRFRFSPTPQGTLSGTSRFARLGISGSTAA